MFATSGQSGGSIYRKTAPLSNINFPTGKGTAVLTDADNDDINNATSTKQAVNSTTGLVVLATNDTTRRYWTHYDPIGGAVAPSAPQASFTANPTSGTAPLDVTFTDTSTELAHLVGVGVRRRRHEHRAQPRPPLRDGRHLHRDPAGHERRRDRHVDPHRTSSTSAPRRRSARR